MVSTSLERKAKPSFKNGPTQECVDEFCPCTILKTSLTSLLKKCDLGSPYWRWEKMTSYIWEGGWALDSNMPLDDSIMVVHKCSNPLISKHGKFGIRLCQKCD